jgi:hypothetical protein
MLSFTAEVYFSLLEQYNRAIWPAQIIAYALALGALFLACRPMRHGSRVIAAALAAAWLWTGIVFHWLQFATISFAAPVIAACFVLQGVLLLWTGVLRGRLAFRCRRGVAGAAGLALAAAALFLHPVLARLTGYRWPQADLVGVAPDSTVLFTVGLLLLSDGRTPWYLLAVPLLWSIVAGLTGWFLGGPELLVLPALGVCGLALILWADWARPSR